MPCSPAMFDYRTKVRALDDCYRAPNSCQLPPAFWRATRRIRGRHGARDFPRNFPRDSQRRLAGKAARQRVHGHARQRSGVARLVRQAAAGDDAVGGGESDRVFSRHRAAHSAHARRARLCRAERARILAVVGNPQTRLCLSCDTKLDRTGFAAAAPARRGVSRIHARRRSWRERRLSMSRAFRRGASCR